MDTIDNQKISEQAALYSHYLVTLFFPFSKIGIRLDLLEVDQYMWRILTSLEK